MIVSVSSAWLVRTIELRRGASSSSSTPPPNTHTKKELLNAGKIKGGKSGGAIKYREPFLQPNATQLSLPKKRPHTPIHHCKRANLLFLKKLYVTILELAMIHPISLGYIFKYHLCVD